MLPESKNMATAINLPYFEEEGYMDDYENIIRDDDTIPESKNIRSQNF